MSSSSSSSSSNSDNEIWKTLDDLDSEEEEEEKLHLHPWRRRRGRSDLDETAEFKDYDPHFSENGGGAAFGGADLKRLPRGQAEDEDDELFRDFKFVSSSNHFNQQQHNKDDDDWGDFVDNFSNSNNNHDFFPSLSSDGFNNLSVNGFFSGQNPSGGAYDATRDLDPFDSSSVESDVNLNSGSVVEKRWEKLRGAIPLSIFGDEEAEEVVAEMEKRCFGVGGDDHRNLESEFGYCVIENLQFPWRNKRK
ncbi:hypothetical protein Syun_022902 [Stephania yunnanensis]|uniref:Uncharacterized protein n=1 Tax=Stephania yunnanensis TaxID=152371 RepID=A0AAP0I325_9MAGN